MNTIKRWWDAFGAWIDRTFGPAVPETDEEWIDRQM
jgi:hypothetical protein